jgi:hypothetical protein
MTDIITDPSYRIHRHQAVSIAEGAYAAGCQALARAVSVALQAGRQPVMIEVIAYVAPQESSNVTR